MKTLKIHNFKLTAPRFNTILVGIGMTDLYIWEASTSTQRRKR